MQTRRDLLHAYRFQMRRALAALVTGEPDVVEPPMRRLTVTTISGIMVAVLVAVGFAVIGLLKPATGDKWKDAGTVIVERETGARYVLLDGVLHPVLNYSSAVLALTGQQRAHVVLVGRSELRHTQRGPAIGIDGIPDSLPAVGRLVRSPWTVCSRLQQGAQGAGLAAQVTLTVGQAVRAAATSQAVPVTSVDGSRTYLLWHGLRLPVDSSDVSTSLGLQGAASLAVGTALLDAVPQGAALRTPQLPQLGQLALGGHALVGQLLHVTDNNTFFVVLDDGIAPVDPLQTALLRTLTVGPGRQHLHPVDITEDIALSLQQSKTTWPAVAQQFDGLPQQIPQVDTTAEQNGGLCAAYPAGATQPTLSVPASLLPSFSGTTVTESDRSRRGQADRVDLSPGSAAVVRSASAATVFVVAEPGRKYAAASTDVLGGFGYGGVDPVVLPSQMLLLIPTGPALDPVAARRPATG